MCILDTTPPGERVGARLKAPDSQRPPGSTETVNESWRSQTPPVAGRASGARLTPRRRLPWITPEIFAHALLAFSFAAPPVGSVAAAFGIAEVLDGLVVDNRHAERTAPHEQRHQHNRDKSFHNSTSPFFDVDPTLGQRGLDANFHKMRCVFPHICADFFRPVISAKRERQGSGFAAPAWRHTTTTLLRSSTAIAIGPTPPAAGVMEVKFPLASTERKCSRRTVRRRRLPEEQAARGSGRGAVCPG